MKGVVKFKLVEWSGQPAVIFEDGDIIYQKDSLGSFLMHVSILMPNCELSENLVIAEDITKKEGKG
jgi:hypothetical protein